MSEDNSIFLDTNIWLYAFLKITEINKAEISHSLINRQGVVISTQVINEVCVNLIKKSSFNESKIKQLIQDFYQGYRVIQFNHKILLLASDLRESYCFSVWDSLIVACAIEAGVEILYSEDMQHGLVVSNCLTIVNPYA